MAAALFEPKEIYKGALAGIAMPRVVNVLAKCLKPVCWLGRKIINITRWFKFWNNVVEDPLLALMGQALAMSQISGTVSFIPIIARILAIIRPLLDFSENGQRLNEEVRKLGDALSRNRGLLDDYLHPQKDTNSRPLNRITTFCGHIVPLAIQRVFKVVSRALCTAFSGVDLLEAIAASTDEVVERSLVEIRRIVQEVGKEKLIRSIEFHQTWINSMLGMVHLKIKAEIVVRFVEYIGGVSVGSGNESVWQLIREGLAGQTG